MAIFQAFGTDTGLTSSSVSSRGLVLSKLPEVRSYNQDKITARGKPTARTIIIIVDRLVGRFNGSVRLPMTSIIANEAVAYKVITCKPCVFLTPARIGITYSGGLP